MAYNAQGPMPPPPPYMMLAEQGGGNSMNLRPPPNRRNLPRYHSEHKKDKGLCRCFCWCFCFLFIFILAIAAVLVYIFIIYKPKIPSYSVANFSVGSFEFNPSELTRNSTLSAGELPSFYQGHKNVTVMHVTLEGTHPYGSGLQKAIEESSNSGSVPLDVFVRVPFSLKLDTIDLREVTVNVHCALVVDSISLDSFKATCLW